MSLRARIAAMFVLTTFLAGAALTALVYAYLKLTPVPFRAEFPGGDAGDAGGAEGAAGAVIDGAVPVADEVLRVVLIVSVVGLLLLTALSGLIGWFVAGWVITPLSGLAHTARQVTAGDLEQRTGYDGADDDVGDLASALDTMLDSLEDSITAQKRFAANASNELKTPIATIQTVADVALATPEDAEHLRTALTQIRSVNADNAAMVSALLDLARAENPELAPVDLGEICGGDDHVAVMGDAVLLRHAVSNLVRNAQTHGENMRLSLTSDGHEARVVVTNDGAVLDPDAVATFTEPFTRGTNRVGDGHGLGLALTDAIARSHGGRLELHARAEGGLTAGLILPVAPAAPATPPTRET